MIVKFYELKKKKLDSNKYFLFYGNNKGLIKETVDYFFKKLDNNYFSYDESEIINNESEFKETILNKSFFEEEKKILINRCSDKIFRIIDEILSLNPKDIIIILTSEILEKKSKLRTLFEKNKNTICVPFYEDNHQSLNLLTLNFLKEKKISLSQQNINLIVDRCRGDRINLYNELHKIESLSKSKKNFTNDDILKITNLSENFNVTELVDNVLAKNQKKTLYILNENNFVSEDSILILRILLNKVKRLIKIHNEIKIKKNVDEAINNFKPPIFWKDKDIVKKQVKILTCKNLEELMIKVNSIELLTKKYPSNSINYVTNFMLEESNELNN
jgi:DNA polymerase-3 subunit delta